LPSSNNLLLIRGRPDIGGFMKVSKARRSKIDFLPPPGGSENGLPQFSDVSRQAPSGWRLTSSLPATRLSPEPRFLNQNRVILVCLHTTSSSYNRISTTYINDSVETSITPPPQQYNLIDILCVVASLM